MGKSKGENWRKGKNKQKTKGKNTRYEAKERRKRNKNNRKKGTRRNKTKMAEMKTKENYCTQKMEKGKIKRMGKIWDKLWMDATFHFNVHICTMYIHKSKVYFKHGKS